MGVDVPVVTEFVMRGGVWRVRHAAGPRTANELIEICCVSIRRLNALAQRCDSGVFNAHRPPHALSFEIEIYEGEP